MWAQTTILSIAKGGVQSDNSYLVNETRLLSPLQLDGTILICSAANEICTEICDIII